MPDFDPSLPVAELVEFIEKKMRMSHIYQPLRQLQGRVAHVRYVNATPEVERYFADLTDLLASEGHGTALETAVDVEPAAAADLAR